MAFREAPASPSAGRTSRLPSRGAVLCSAIRRLIDSQASHRRLLGKPPMSLRPMAWITSIPATIHVFSHMVRTRSAAGAFMPLVIAVSLVACIAISLLLPRLHRPGPRAELRADWWSRFETEFRAYARRASHDGRDENGRPR